MPPHRRRPAPSTSQAPPIRRPKVAGLRNRPGATDEPAATPETTTPETPEPPETTREITEEPTGRAPVEQDRESVSGVLNGVLGEPPAAREDTTREDPLAERPAEPDEPTRAAGAAEPVEDEPPVTRPKPRPAVEGERRPAGKRRTTGAARPTDLAAAETGEGTTGTTGTSRHVRAEQRPVRSKASRQISVAVLLALVAVVLAVLAVYFRGQAEDLKSGDSNTALTDSATTSQLKGQLTTAIKQTFSYNYTDLDSTAKAVKENLTGKALCEYDLLFGEVKEFAPAQKFILETSVRDLAVVRIDGDRAEALIYYDQLSTRVDVNKTAAVSGQFGVKAQRAGDHWKITEFDMFGQPLFDGKQPPKC